MEHLIDKDALVTEIERRIKEHHSGYLVCLKDILSFINTLEVKEVDLEKEIQYYVRNCLDVKFPTTDIEQIKKDVEYTARMFFELGLKAAQKGE